MTLAAVKPTGTKREIYADLALAARGLFRGERDAVANAANLSSLIFNGLDNLNWAGFYFLKDGMLVPSTVDLSGAELELIDVPRRNYRLKDALEQYSAHGHSPFSYVLIDCPPSLTLLTVNAMVAADAVIVPLQTEFFALEGLSQLLNTIERVRVNLNPALEIQGIVLTMFDKRNKLSDEVAADVRAHMGDKVYNTIIPRNVRISEAPSHGLPALVYDLRCPGSQAYIKLAGEMIQRERARVAA